MKKVRVAADREFFRRIAIPLLVFLVAVGSLLAFAIVATALPLDPIDRDLDPVNPPTFRAPPNGFRWSVPSRFGSRDSNGLIDYHWNPVTNSYDPSYVQPTSFPVNFDGCQTAGDADGSPENTYTWVEVLADGVTRGLTTANTCDLTYGGWKSQGAHTVRLTVQNAGGTPVPAGSTQPFERVVTIKDWLIVSIGDSYASGEGNPDVAQQVRTTSVGDGVLRGEVLQPTRWVDERCHRSATAGPAQAALALESEDSRTSVTFVSLACSGATIDAPTFDQDDPLKPQGTGILGSYRGAAPPAGVGYSERERLPAQLDALRALVGSRQIDALIISGGGNDIGFGNIAAICVAHSKCYEKKVDDNFVPDDDGRALAAVVTDKIAALADRYDRLGAAIYSPPAPAQPLNVANVLVTEYPDLTKNTNREYCGRILHDIAFWPLDMSAAESAWAVGSVLGPLNGKVQAAATENASRGWRYVSGIGAAYSGATDGAGHGYCASDNWIRTATEAMYMQGPFPLYLGDGSAFVTNELDAKKATKGTLHPTAAGHRIYKERILDNLHLVLKPPTSNPSPVPPPSFSISNSVAEVSGSATSTAGSSGWLVGSCQGSTCTSGSVVLTITAQDSAAIRAASFLVNGSAVLPAGVTVDRRLSSDGKSFAWSFRITQGGVYRLQLSAKGDADQVSSLTHEVKVDLTDPTALSVIAATPTSDGWYRGPLEVILLGRDTSNGNGSGVDRIEYRIDGGELMTAPAGGPATIAEDGPHTLTYQAIDLAGRPGTVQTLVLRVDATPPTIVCAAADALWQASNVSIPCTASDAASGLEVSADASFALATSVEPGTETANAVTTSREVYDKAGNRAVSGPIVGNKVDLKAPTITIDTPRTANYLLSQTVTADFACADGGSGVAPCVGTVPNGGALDTGSVGQKTFTVSAADAVGNAATQSVTYGVTYNVCVLYDQSKSHRPGSVAPIKVQLCDAAGGNASSSAITVTAEGLQKMDSTASTIVAEDVGSANPDGNFRYDLTLGGYIYNLSTKGLTTGSYELTFRVSGDPSSYRVAFDVR